MPTDLDGSVGARYVRAMQLDLPEKLSLRAVRLQVNYSAARLNALPETRDLAKDFEEAAEKFAQLEAEEARLAIQRVETQAMVEIADDAWDDTIHAFQRRLLEACGNSQDHALYRLYFAEIPSHVTTMSYAAEILISKDLEESLMHEANEDLRAFSDRLRDKRFPLEGALHERTRLEVEEARFSNRVQLAKALVNKLRRITHANLEEIASAHGRGGDWSVRYFHAVNPLLAAMDADGAGSNASMSGGAAPASNGVSAEAEAAAPAAPASQS